MLEIQDYLYGIAVGGTLFLLMLSPVIYALIVALWPGSRPARKLRFSVVCGLIAYGSSIFTFVLTMPYQMVAMYFAPNWQDQGWQYLPKMFAIGSDSIEIFSLLVGAGVGLAAPIYIRKRVWAKIYPDNR